MFHAVFIKSAHQLRQFPADEGREVAFAGRSNSGKSSAINAVLAAPKLARTSKTPGRTQLVNFFEVAPGRRVVDLPGYGYARVPADVRRHWQGLLESYFARRGSLSGLMMTLDVRRGFTDLDARMLAWTEPLEVPVALLLTKADKLSRGGLLEQRRAVQAAAPRTVELITFSAVDRRGVEEARQRLLQWLGMAPDGST